MSYKYKSGAQKRRDCSLNQEASVIGVSKLSEFGFVSSTKAQSEICDDNEGVPSSIQADFVNEQTAATPQGIGVAVTNEDGIDHTNVNSSGCDIGLFDAIHSLIQLDSILHLVTCVHQFGDHVMQAVVLFLFRLWHTSIKMVNCAVAAG